MPFQKGHPSYITKETGKIISEALKGRKRPSFSEQWKSNISKAGLGKKQTFETIRKKTETRLARGYRHSENTKKKIGLANKGYKHSEEFKKNCRERVIDNPPKKFKDTSIELKIEAELLSRNINYQKQVPLCKIGRVDFYLPEYRIVIQCDGDYWHNLPDHKVRDEMQNKILIFNGFNVYRFWEHEINESAKECINKIIYE